MIIGRKKEIFELNECYKAANSSFVAIYGRRRIGKTYLVNEFFNDKLLFKHAGIYNGTYKEQLNAFYSSLSEQGYTPNQKFDDWFQAFDALKLLIKTSESKKKVIFFDEIGWIYTKKSNFIKALEYFWNGWASLRNDVMFIICSSATSWIINNIIHSKGGLYNRVTTQISLEPFTLKECEEYSKYRNLSLSRKQIIDAYMVIGGIPFYWNYIKKGDSIAQFIDSNFFDKNAAFRNEFKYIFSSLFAQPNDYIKIIESLSTKKYGLTRKEIIDDTKLIDNGLFTGKLEDLINCGFIREYSPMNYKKKSVIYQLIDPFTIFHFHFLTNKTNDDNYFENQINTPLINTWEGLSFERICLLHLNNIKKALGVSGVYTSVYPWSCKKDLNKGIYGSQIDMVVERKDDVINLIEIKYTNRKYSITSQYMDTLEKKKHDFIELTKTKSSIHLTFITLNGLEENSYSKEIQSVITIEDLFS